MAYSPRMTIEPGDVVELLSGGSPMNVRSVSNRHAFCSWYDDSGARHSDVFRLDALRLLHKLPEAKDSSEGPSTIF